MYLKYTEMAKELGVSVRTLKGWVADRVVPYIKIRRLVFFEPEKVGAALSKFERRAVSKL